MHMYFIYEYVAILGSDVFACGMYVCVFLCLCSFVSCGRVTSHPACTEGHVELRLMTSTDAVILRKISDIKNIDAYINVLLQIPSS